MITETPVLTKVYEQQVKEIPINQIGDISQVTSQTYVFARHIGFGPVQRTMIATAVSELANNILCYAQQGMMTLKHITRNKKSGIEVTATDFGPGISDIDLALQDEYSTGGSLGLGLPGAKRLMDEFHFDAQRERGTKIILRRWL